MRILGLVPARGGSKGIPGKNIKLLGGKPLLAYTAEAALASHALTRVVLSTEDPAIAEVGKKCGLEVPFLRPQQLAEDSSPTLPVIQHALEWFAANGEDFEALCLLQPTNPFRSTEDIEKAISLLVEGHADTVLAMRQVPKEYHPGWVYLADESGDLRLANGDAQPTSRRQDLPPAYHRDGSIYLTRTSVIQARQSLYGERIRGFEPQTPYVNLDTPEDWARAEAILAEMGASRG